MYKVVLGSAILLPYQQDDLKEGYLKDLKQKLEQFEAYMKGKKYFAGDEVMYDPKFVSFEIFAYLSQTFSV